MKILEHCKTSIVDFQQYFIMVIGTLDFKSVVLGTALVRVS